MLDPGGVVFALPSAAAENSPNEVRFANAVRRLEAPNVYAGFVVVGPDIVGAAASCGYGIMPEARLWIRSTLRGNLLFGMRCSYEDDLIFFDVAAADVRRGFELVTGVFGPRLEKHAHLCFSLEVRR